MIAELRGTISKKALNHIVLEVGGVGYLVTIPLSTYARLPEDNEPTHLFIHTHVREDAISLFGFLTEREKELFMDLISISGIGPKLATTILSGASPEEITRYIAVGDVAAFVRLPGVGKKTAERIVLELKEKLKKRAFGEGIEGMEGGLDLSDVVEALVNLGYTRSVANDAVGEAARSGAEDLGEILKGALKVLSRV